jgi:hypothetical protein
MHEEGTGMADSVTQFSGGWYAAPSSTATGTVAYTDGVLIPSNAINKSVSQATTTISAIDTNAAGVKFSLFYSLRCAYNLTFAGQVRARVKWATTTGAGGGATGRWNLDIRRKDVNGNVSTISGLVKGNGATRSVAGVSNYVDNQIVTNVPTQSFTPGESLVAVLEFEVIATNAANTLVVVCSTNPATSGDELIIELDSGTP